MKEPIVNILILNWNNKNILSDCISSILKSTYNNYIITVIDNGSTDGSIKKLDSQIELIQLEKNYQVCKIPEEKRIKSY